MNKIPERLSRLEAQVGAAFSRIDMLERTTAKQNDVADKLEQAKARFERIELQASWLSLQCETLQARIQKLERRGFWRTLWRFVKRALRRK